VVDPSFLADIRTTSAVAGMLIKTRIAINPAKNRLLFNKRTDFPFIIFSFLLVIHKYCAKYYKMIRHLAMSRSRNNHFLWLSR